LADVIKKSFKFWIRRHILICFENSQHNGVGTRKLQKLIGRKDIAPGSRAYSLSICAAFDELPDVF